MTGPVLTRHHRFGNLCGMDLRTYLKSLGSIEEREQYAKRAGTTLGYLRKVLSTKQSVSVKLAVSLARESGGAVRIESLKPDVDWAYVREGAPISGEAQSVEVTQV